MKIKGYDFDLSQVGVTSHEDDEDLDTIFTAEDIEDEIDRQEWLKSSRIINLNGEITEKVIDDICLKIIGWNMEDCGLTAEEREPIHIYIHSNGGDVIAGFAVVDVIQNSETPVIGIGFGKVYSMAFSILTACQASICFPHTTFLLHDGTFGTEDSGSKFLDFAEFAKKNLVAKTREHVLETTNIDAKWYDENIRKENWIDAHEAKEFGIVQYIIGEDVPMDILWS